MQHRLMTDTATFQPTAAFEPLAKLATIQTANIRAARRERLITFALAAVAFAAAFGVVAFVL